MLNWEGTRLDNLTYYANLYDAAVEFIVDSHASTLSVEILLIQCTWNVRIRILLPHCVTVRHYSDRLIMNVRHTIYSSHEYFVIMIQPVSQTFTYLSLIIFLLLKA